MSFIKSVDTEEKILWSVLLHIWRRETISSIQPPPLFVISLFQYASFESLSFAQLLSSSRHKLGENMADKVSCDDDDEPWLQEDYEPARKTFPLVLLQLIDILNENTFAINSFLAYCDAFFFCF